MDVSGGVLQLNVSGVAVQLNGVQLQPASLANNYRTLPPSAFFLALERDFIEVTTGLNATTNSNPQYPEMIFQSVPPRGPAMTTVPPGTLNFGNQWLVKAPYPAGGLTSNYSKCIWVSLSPLNGGAGPYDLLGSEVALSAGSHFLTIDGKGVVAIGHGGAGGAGLVLPAFWPSPTAAGSTCAACTRRPLPPFALYVNGSRAASSGAGQQGWSGGLPVSIGVQRFPQGNSTVASLGSVQCAQWYPTALSSQQVSSIYALQAGWQLPILRRGVGVITACFSLSSIHSPAALYPHPLVRCFGLSFDRRRESPPVLQDAINP